MTIQETEQKYLEQFAQIDDEFDKYTWMMYLAGKLPQAAEELHRDENLLKDCQSKVWLTMKMENGRVRIQADSDTLIIKGLLTMMTELLDNRTPGEIRQHDILLFRRLDVESVLNDARKAGMNTLVDRIRDFARNN